MTPEEVIARISAIEERIRAHTEEEDVRWASLDQKVNEIHTVFVGAKGAARVLGWIIGGLGALAAAWSWVISNFHVGVR